jgi:Ca2+-binding EF-hand superfamily protein
MVDKSTNVEELQRLFRSYDESKNKSFGYQLTESEMMLIREELNRLYEAYNDLCPKVGMPFPTIV